MQGSAGQRIIRVEPGNPVHPDRGLFEIDAVLGFRPILGGPEYGPHGALWNDHPLAKRPGLRRLLFLGDSVTRRGKIVEPLCAELGPAVECWNAGVIGYSSRQELDYYRLHCADLHADHVVLTFHLNDYETTPVTFVDGDRMVAVYGRLGSRHPNGWLLRHSYLYRLYWTRSLRSAAPDRPEDLEREVADALRGIQALAAERGAELTLFVLPWLEPPGAWSDDMRAGHARTLRLLEALGIRHLDFLATLERAVADGVDVQETPGDLQHPSAEFGKRLARAALDQGFRP